MKYLYMNLLLITTLLSLSAIAQQTTLRGPIPFDAFDLDNDNKVTKDEFNRARNERLTQKAKQGAPMRKLSSAPSFEDIDLNSDGFLTMNELTAHQSKKANRNK